MAVKIRVTQDHIDQGCRYNAEFCPIALAAAGLFPGNMVLVNGQQIVTYSEPMLLVKTGEFELPETARQFTWDFDHRNPVEAFEFEVDA